MNGKEGGLRIVRWLKIILAVVGFLAILKYAVIALIEQSSDSDEDVKVTVYPSPNGRYSAAHVVRSGGGACLDAVVVFNNLLDLSDVVKNDNYQVYSAACDTFIDHENSPKIQWDSDNDLQVGFAIGGARVFSRNVDLRGLDASGNIQIRFSAYR